MTSVRPMAAARPFPALSVCTPRLDVRGLTAEDAADVVGVFASSAAQRWLSIPSGYSIDDGCAWCTSLADRERERGAGDNLAIVRRLDQRLVGCAWLRRTDWDAQSTEVALAVRDDVWGFGVAPEAVDAITVALVREHGFRRVEVRVAPGNHSARRVAEKAGFTYEGLLRDAGSLHDDRIDLELWSLVSADL